MQLKQTQNSAPVKVWLNSSSNKYRFVQSKFNQIEQQSIYNKSKKLLKNQSMIKYEELQRELPIEQVD